jgi:hypothetical protein
VNRSLQEMMVPVPESELTQFTEQKNHYFKEFSMKELNINQMAAIERGRNGATDECKKLSGRTGNVCYSGIYPNVADLKRKKMGIVSLLSVILAFVCFVSSCGNNSTEVQKFASVQELNTHLIASEHRVCWSLKLPQGATVTNNGSGNIALTMPKGIRMVGLNKKTNEYVTLGSYTCECNGVGSCSPFQAGDMVGCFTHAGTPCPNCVGKTGGGSTAIQSSRFRDTKGELFDCSEIYFEHELDSTSIVDRSYGRLLRSKVGISVMTPVSTPAQLRGMQPVTAAILNDANISQQIQTMLKEYADEYKNADCSGNKIPRGFALVPVSVMGYLAYCVVPRTKLEKGMIEVGSGRSRTQTAIDGGGEAGGTVSCSGSCSGGSCKLQSSHFGQIKYCDGCSSGCTIHY